jgi:hypothetical protein
LGIQERGGVGYFVEISSLETTNAQYADCLNSVDPSGANSKSIDNDHMESDTNGGINKVVNGTPYVVETGFETQPVHFVTCSKSFSCQLLAK